ncbi:hypothetical protein ABC855_g2671 [[Candida] zeylanoides]
MEFEQAYSTYSALQQKNALNEIENLKRVQLLNSQYDSAFAAGSTGSGAGAAASAFPGNSHFSFQQPHLQPNDAFGYSQGPSYDLQRGGYAADKDANVHDDFDHFFSSTESNALEKFLDNLASSNSTGSPPPPQQEFYTHHNPAQHHNSTGGSISSPMPMSMAAMASPIPPVVASMAVGAHPVPDYNQRQPKIPAHHQQQLSSPHQPQPQSYYSATFDKPHDMHTLKSLITPPPPPHHYQHRPVALPDLKHEIDEAFSHPPALSKSSITEMQLPTPTSSNRQSPPGKRAFEDDDDEESDDETNGSADGASAAKKRKRSSTKQLLTLEQKRLNHSHSEQKRRQLCKLAYERCLRLIVNLEEYISIHGDGKKTVKRKQKLRDGLPNISKHTALVKISDEIMVIQEKNRALEALLA